MPTSTMNSDPAIGDTAALDGDLDAIARDTGYADGLEYAGFWIRLVATLVDTILLFVITAPLLFWIYGANYWTDLRFIHGPAEFLISYVAPAVATVLFPLMSRHTAREDWEAFKSTTAMGLRFISFLLLPASAAAAVLAMPIVRLLYQHGAFTASQTHVVAPCLAAFSLGLTFNGTMLMLNRGFFSLQSPWIPTTVAVMNLAINAGLDAAFYRFGIWGIPLSTSIVNIAGTWAMLALFRRRVGGFEMTETVQSFVLVTVASAVLAAVGWWAWHLLDSGLVIAEVDAQRRLYRLRAEPLRELDAWVAPYRPHWAHHLDALERHLATMSDGEAPTHRSKR